MTNLSKTSKAVNTGLQ